MKGIIRAWFVKHHWNSKVFGFYVWWISHFGKKLDCGCRGACDGHKGYI